MSETFACESCGGTFPKGWSDAEAAAEAQELFPGIAVTDAAESGVVCDGCYQHIMARVRVEAPELIGELIIESINTKGASANLDKMAKEKAANVNELLQDTGEYGK